MKLFEILNEEASAGSVSGSSIAGFRSPIGFKPLKRVVDNLPKVQKLKYSNSKPLYRFI